MPEPSPRPAAAVGSPTVSEPQPMRPAAKPSTPARPAATATKAGSPAQPAGKAPQPAVPAAKPLPAKEPTPRAPGFLRGNADILIGAGLMVLAAIARALPTGPRAAITLPVLLVVPGYLLIQALRAGPRNHRFGRDLVVGIGISLPIVGLLALMAATVPGGFQAGIIVAVVTVAGLAMAAVAAMRRRRLVLIETPSATATPIE